MAKEVQKAKEGELQAAPAMVQAPAHIQKSTATVDVSELILPVVTAQGTGKSGFKITHGDAEYQAEVLKDCIIVKRFYTRSYYEGAYRQGSSDAPVCFADPANSETGLEPSDESPKKQSESCASCALAKPTVNGQPATWKEWRDAPAAARGASPCRVRPGMIVLRRGRMMPMRFRGSPTMIKSFKGWLNTSLDQFGYPPDDLRWHLQVHDHEGDKKLVAIQPENEEPAWLTVEELALRDRTREQFMQNIAHQTRMDDTADGGDSQPAQPAEAQGETDAEGNPFVE